MQQALAGWDIRDEINNYSTVLVSTRELRPSGTKGANNVALPPFKLECNHLRNRIKWEIWETLSSAFVLSIITNNQVEMVAIFNNSAIKWSNREQQKNSFRSYKRKCPVASNLQLWVFWNKNNFPLLSCLSVPNYLYCELQLPPPLTWTSSSTNQIPSY